MSFLFGRKSRGAVFQSPIQPVPKTAILAPGFAESRTVRVFPEGWTEQAARFQPTALAGPIHLLCRLGPKNIELKHSVVAFTTLEARLSEHDRDFLWILFGVPVFEQCLGAHNELAAFECEAHDGVHLAGGFSRPGLALNSTPCACGSTVPRLGERKVAAVA